MPRRPYKKRIVKPEPVYNSSEVTKLINYIMKDGEKEVAQNIVYQVFNELTKQKQDPLKVLNLAIQHVAPNFEVKPRRLGGASYLVPTEVRRERRLFLALNWIIQAANAKSNKEFKTFTNKLLTELLDASNNQGQAVNKRIQTEKLAEANKAFAHLKW
ncbi:30S ribosomal protein S7 [Candidatus Roizmanbacteria bacterium RIFCSPHIGHO2_02_FULL_37_15]|uniref:Small ribosomal subunit protein uS7 n=1 Tax=Candidatus Roizmanbacteria bacterium RIFCSPLOWO2_01_FULL_37_16 TaxID=1802058 RepID=A0A1F7IQ63_9BACT|nr:MAG: 30S ribosomal protein S7 [Candidatus Roizmanbacteria bacterium RIFCSPHIGHO2_01_FULL_37_16b]OGK21181.1 MAG: 30S ribosomal protein S7 [Candidatus Roizmanbacteria bacterium RIFCSPHIGHO2_02_FULL_37_15]OGK32864.1 MAG: 30S ribosomal protein S7 [Candidatus Roizmanbacteria bacterium RIFCSPHIGHO2_12_FULL_36_11]OGK45504.1 MAG: 30S ribosomal protein S7 [Candidatus Roizmanbacteria bacterium RIFCSPLOWO2_01_FULL_37_16]OGK55709.1 MAG: 30S ribosomal protein S7 [Candidatus Roizmanbacteria bacterium RIFC